MQKECNGKFLKIFIDESDKWKGHPLSTAIMKELKKYNLSGATIIRGVEGFGQGHKIHTEFIEVLSRNLPIVMEIIDEEEKIDSIIEVIGPMVEEGAIAVIDNVKLIKCIKQ